MGKPLESTLSIRSYGITMGESRHINRDQWQKMTDLGREITAIMIRLDRGSYKGRKRGSKNKVKNYD
jgi:hypothetical protein